MSSIYDLGQDDLTRLYAIDPVLDKDWQQTLATIMPKLDSEDRSIAQTQILSPKGITYHLQSDSYSAKNPKTLEQVLQTTNISNRHLLKAAQELLGIYPPPHIPSMPSLWLMRLRLL